ncbi:MAG: hypothetical protein LAP85_27990 [Acidobacteriia bacterium]|nr:hypothetical protein [Terriglobia bacterium]
MSLSITTNLATYTFPSMSVPNVSAGLIFEGFVAGSGEYFTSFNLSSDVGYGVLPIVRKRIYLNTRRSAAFCNPTPAVE